MGDWTAYRSSTRGSRTDASTPRVKTVKSPVGPDSTTVGMRREPSSPAPFYSMGPRPEWNVGGSMGWREAGGGSFTPPSLPSPPATQQAAALRGPQGSIPEVLRALREGYATGGFEGVQNLSPDWYDIPDYLRTQILSASMGGM